MPRFLARLPYGAKTDPVDEFDFEEEGRDEEDAALKARVLRGRFGGVARQAALDPDDGVAL